MSIEECLLACGVGAAGVQSVGQALHRKPRAPEGMTTPAQRIDELKQLAHSARDMTPQEQEAKAAELVYVLQTEKDTLVRAQLLKTLAAIPVSATGQVLAAGLTDSDRDVRVAACEAWVVRGGPEATQKLAEALSSDTEIDVRLAAAKGLGKLGDPQAVQHLAVALTDPDPALQHCAVESLREITGQEFGNDVNAWHAFAQGGNPEPHRPSVAERVRSWFF